MNINEKMVEIQSEMNVPKNLYNSFGKYNYRSCESILETAKPVLKKHGCLLYLSDDIVEVGGRIYVQAIATMIDSESGEQIQNSAFAREADSKKGMDDSQVTGTASSYARKYALNGLFCLDDNKDADTDEYQKSINAKEEMDDPLIDEANLRSLKDYAESLDVSDESICERFGVNNLEDLRMTQFVKAIKMLEATERKRA